MNKPFDLSKLRKTLTKSITGLSIGFNDPTTWIDTGNHSLNYLISGDFFKGIPLGKVSMLAGESGCLPDSGIVSVVLSLKDQTVKTRTVLKDCRVGVLRELYNSNKYDIELDTPDGLQLITAWFDKGPMELVRITTDKNKCTVCASNHLIEAINFEGQRNWILAENITPNHVILTIDGPERVSNFEYAGIDDCYDFTIDHPNHRYWGDSISSHNSGKSLLAANVIKHAQETGIYVILIDTENALDESWLKAFDIETDESKILKLNMAMVDDVAKTITEFIKEYKEIPEEDRPKVLFIIDSLGMLLVNAQVEQFERGELKGDFGHKPKALKALITNCVNMFGNLGIGLLATNHTYSSQNIFSPDDVISGGSGPIFAASILVAMKKGKLKEDEDGGKTTDVAGIRAMCKVMKTRYNKPFEGTELKIPYAGGLDRYSGLFELFEGHGMLTKNGNRYSYVSLSGDKINFFKKEWYKNTNDCLTTVMTDIMSKPGGLFKPDFEFAAENLSEEVSNEDS